MGATNRRARTSDGVGKRVVRGERGMGEEGSERSEVEGRTG